MTDSPTVHDPGELRDRRFRAGLNQEDLAKLVGVHPSYISHLERDSGSKSPTGRTLKKLADALGCEPGDLMRKRKNARPRTAAPAAPRASARRAA